MLNLQQISEFQTLYRIRFGVELSKKEATEKGMQVISLMRITYRPMTESEYKYLQKRRKETNYNYNNKTNDKNRP